ncbi:inovirus Gp2 family protein [Salmonella enterica]|nr:inovirus Gp2 family protein [Salmonella enterica]
MSESYLYHPLYIDRIQQTVNSAVSDHSRLACFFATLRFPQQGQCRDDSEVISRFFDALKYQINRYIDIKRSEDKRVHATTLHAVWAREFGARNGNKHYHVALMLNKDTFHALGHYSFSATGAGSLAILLQKAWCSATGLSPELYASLVSFPPDLPCMWIEHNEPYQRTAVEQRMFYLAKTFSKRNGDGERSFGCTQHSPTLLNGRKTRT